MWGAWISGVRAPWRRVETEALVRCAPTGRRDDWRLLPTPRFASCGAIFEASLRDASQCVTSRCKTEAREAGHRLSGDSRPQDLRLLPCFQAGERAALAESTPSLSCALVPLSPDKKQGTREQESGISPRFMQHGPETPAPDGFLPGGAMPRRWLPVRPDARPAWSPA